MYKNIWKTPLFEFNMNIYMRQCCCNFSSSTLYTNIFVEILKKLKSTYQEIQHSGITPLISYTIKYLPIIRIKFDKIIPSDVLFSHVFKYLISFYLIIIDEPICCLREHIPTYLLVVQKG